MLHWPNPRRLAWVYATTNLGGDGNFGQIGLYNNSTGPHVLCVHDVIVDPAQNGAPGGALLIQGKLSGTDFRPIPAFTGEAVPVGLATGGESVTQPTFSFMANLSTEWTQSARPWPTVFLQPGWSMLWSQATASSDFGLSFLYEWRWAWEFPVIPNSPYDL